MSDFRVGDKVTVSDGSWSICISRGRLFERLYEHSGGVYEVIALPTEENAKLIEKGHNLDAHNVMIMNADGIIYLHSDRCLTLKSRSIRYPVIATPPSESSDFNYYVMFTSSTSGLVIYSGDNAAHPMGHFTDAWVSVEEPGNPWIILDRDEVEELVNKVGIGLRVS